MHLCCIKCHHRLPYMWQYPSLIRPSSLGLFFPFYTRQRPVRGLGAAVGLLCRKWVIVVDALPARALRHAFLLAPTAREPIASTLASSPSCTGPASVTKSDRPPGPNTEKGRRSAPTRVHHFPSPHQSRSKGPCYSRTDELKDAHQ